MNNQPDRVSGMTRNILFRAAGAAILVISFVVAWFSYDYRVFQEAPVNLDAPLVYDIPQGMTLGTLSNDLYRRGVISNALYFTWMVRLQGKAGAIQAGEYELKPGSTPREIAWQIINGLVIRHELTIVEGWNIYQVLDAVRANRHLVHTIEDIDHSSIMSALGLDEPHPEGLFFPDTSHFTKGMTDRDFMVRAYRAMKLRLEQEWAQREEGLPLSTPYEALILASIIEKETAVAGERRQIAGVFTRRLMKGMLLQTDPTVIYGIGRNFNGNITRRDLRTDTPYNTYTRKGLPPTPIAMPGADSIHAALHPGDGESLYFVAKGDGSHYFSSSLEEHNRAVVKYQLKGKGRAGAVNTDGNKKP
jgi:UPF0755 protein